MSKVINKTTVERDGEILYKFCRGGLYSLAVGCLSMFIWTVTIYGLFNAIIGFITLFGAISLLNPFGIFALLNK